MGICALFTTLHKQGWIDDTIKFVVPKYDATYEQELKTKRHLQLDQILRKLGRRNSCNTVHFHLFVWFCLDWSFFFCFIAFFQLIAKIAFQSMHMM